jgi:zinc transporter, ZIP family
MFSYDPWAYLCVHLTGRKRGVISLRWVLVIQWHDRSKYQERESVESLLYSFFAGLSMALGALIVLCFGQVGARVLSLILGFAAGVMLAISAFDLIPEAMELGSLTHAIVGFLLGAGMMYVLDLTIPHAHMTGDLDGPVTSLSHEKINSKKILRTGYLIFLGMALHNIPEGLAIGAGLQSSPELGLTIAIAIGLHNVPEGMATAGPLKAGGLTGGKVLLLTTIAGIMTPLGALLGVIAFGISESLVAMGMALAAGAMVYISSDELIPQSHKYHSHMANFGILGGFLIGFALSG